MEPIGKVLENYQPVIPPQNYYDENQEQEKQARIRMLRGITDSENTFENIRCPKGYELTLTTLKEMSEGTATYCMALIYGGTGNGKSRGLEALVLRLLEREQWCSRERWSDLVRQMRSRFNGKADQPYDEYFDNLRSRARLIIDDVGNGTTWGDWERGELEEIVDFRYEHRLFTVITTNMDLKSNFPERIISRFKDKSRARLVLNEAADQRPMQ